MPILKNLINDDLYGTSWLGEVMDIEDPLKIGRVKIKVFGKFDEIPTEDLPWAQPGNNITGGSDSGGGFFSVPKKGSIVSVKFDNGNIYHPEYFFVQKISNEVKEEIKDSYENAHVIVYDTITEGGLKIFFTEEKGLMLDYQETQINIKNDKSILIQTASGDSKVEIMDDGKMTITQADEINIKTDKDLVIKCDNAKITADNSVDINCKNAKIKASSKAIVDAPAIELGEGATEAVIKGTTFAQIFDNHIHPTPVGPSSKPTTPMQPSLSQIVKTK
jgi:hypothetical protein